MRAARLATSGCGDVAAAGRHRHRTRAQQMQVTAASPTSRASGSATTRWPSGRPAAPWCWSTARARSGGVSQRGGAPGTRETDLLDPPNLVDKVNAIVLSGGSAYGLDAAQGVVRYLEERKIGWNVGAAGVVPIVPAAILFDLGFGGDPQDPPDGRLRLPGRRGRQRRPGRRRQRRRRRRRHGRQDGAGATRAMKGGIGTAAITLPNGLVVGAIVAVNAVGDIIDPSTGRGRRRRANGGRQGARRRARAPAHGALPAAPPRRAGREHDDRRRRHQRAPDARPRPTAWR